MSPTSSPDNQEALCWETQLFGPSFYGCDRARRPPASMAPSHIRSLVKKGVRLTCSQLTTVTTNVREGTNNKKTTTASLHAIQADGGGVGRSRRR